MNIARTDVLDSITYNSNGSSREITLHRQNYFFKILRLKKIKARRSLIFYVPCHICYSRDYHKQV